ncbi:MAG: hypothetical protein E7324_06690 [Clostridiales bacterium]|nr:hypothetical protein [Clostridiales bacterium]
MADEKHECEADMTSAGSVCPPAAEEKPVDAQEMPFLGFVGSYTHGIDAKGRLIIPASFREPLGNRFAVAPTPDFQAVALYTIAGWLERRDELLALVKINARAQRLLDQFSKYSYVDCEADGQGRLLLPQKIRAWRLGDAREVDVNGATTHIRIIPAEDSRKQDMNFDEEFADPLAMIAEMQQGRAF